MRQSNFELLRIIAMLAVLVVHASFLSVAQFDHAAITAHGASIAKYGLAYLFEGFSLMCVNLFVMISGWFGIRPKARSVGNLVFQILFWCGLLGIYYLHAGRIELSQYAEYLLCGNGYSFVPCYLMLMLIAIPLNTFADKCTKRELQTFLISWFGAQTLFGWIIAAWPYGSGSSLPLFIGIYLLGRYLSRFPLTHISFGRGIALYLSITSLWSMAVFVAVLLIDNNMVTAKILDLFKYYTSPVNILAAAILIVAFSRLQFQSQVVNRLARSSFVVYLAHMYPPGVVYFRQFFGKLFSNCEAWLWPIAMLASCCTLYLAIAMVDTLRLALWNLLTRQPQKKSRRIV